MVVNIFEFFFVYLATWWITLFVVLPFGVERDDYPQAGHDSGAPIKANIKKKFLINSVLAFFVALAIYLPFAMGWLSLKDLAKDGWGI